MPKIRASAWLLKMRLVRAKRENVSTCWLVDKQLIEDSDLCNNLIKSLSNLGNSYIQEVKLSLNQRST